jgi:hypothetical protein
MRRCLIILFIPIMMSFAHELAVGGDSVIQRYHYRVMANDPDTMITQLRKITRDNGGYVKFFSNEKIVIRLPGDMIATIRSSIAEAGFIADERLFRKDVSEIMLELNTRLRVKKKLLQKLYGIFNSARLAQTLDVEREVGKVVTEIESIKGKIAFYRDRVSLPEITIDVSKSSRSSVRRKAHTQWEWIRKLGIEGLLMSF